MGFSSRFFETNFLPLVKKLQQFEADCQAENGASISIARLITLIDEHFQNAPSLFVLHKDMLSEDTELNQAYSEKIGARGYNALIRIMQILMNKGICRSDISPEHAAYLICVLGAVHYIMTPMANTTFHSLMEGERTAELGALATTLLSPNPIAPHSAV